MNMEKKNMSTKKRTSFRSRALSQKKKIHDPESSVKFRELSSSSIWKKEMNEIPFLKGYLRTYFLKFVTKRIIKLFRGWKRNNE